MKLELPSADLIKLLPPSQYKAMTETPEAFEDEVKRLNTIVASIPTFGETERLKRHPLSLHYFIGGCDWYICEWDREEDLFFGYAILNGDYDNSEWGYMSREEIVNLEFPEKFLMANPDLHCHDQTIEDALYRKSPSYFWRYKPEEEE